MIIQVSEKHAEGKYGSEISDGAMEPEAIMQCSVPHWEHYIVINIKENFVGYINTIENMMYEQSPYSYCKAFKKNTVITFTQDKLS